MSKNQPETSTEKKEEDVKQDEPKTDAGAVQAKAEDVPDGDADNGELGIATASTVHEQCFGHWAAWPAPVAQWLVEFGMAVASGRPRPGPNQFDTGGHRVGAYIDDAGDVTLRVFPHFVSNEIIDRRMENLINEYTNLTGEEKNLKRMAARRQEDKASDGDFKERLAEIKERKMSLMRDMDKTSGEFVQVPSYAVYFKARDLAAKNFIVTTPEMPLPNFSELGPVSMPSHEVPMPKKKAEKAPEEEKGSE